jgi:capsular exopolysaccharide biosynthesis protein (wzm)
MKIISVLDTTISDCNLGNQIIMEAINKVINELFEQDFVFRIQYAEKFGRQSLNYIKKADYSFFGGTNLLSSKMNKNSQMGFKVSDLIFIKDKLTLFGVGWWQYQSKPNFYTKFFLKKLLSGISLHSVRDTYTKQMLEGIGITNVINTSCPTTWGLTMDHCNDIPTTKSENALITLTDYNQVRYCDEKFLKVIFSNYKKVFYWVQGVGDLKYISSFENVDKDRLFVVPPKLYLYDEILNNEDVDYIGTRLHAGIRAIQYKKRALILAVDNRANEISKDINLNTVNRSNLSGILGFISHKYKTKLDIPFSNIKRWKEQFK